MCDSTPENCWAILLRFLYDMVLTFSFLRKKPYQLQMNLLSRTFTCSTLVHTFQYNGGCARRNVISCQFTKHVHDKVVTNFKVLCENLMMTIQVKCIERNYSWATVYYTQLPLTLGTFLWMNLSYLIIQMKGFDQYCHLRFFGNTFLLSQNQHFQIP